jgi:hypothetical protein
MPGVYYRDALWIGVCGTAGILGIRRLVEFLSAHWQTVHRSYSLTVGRGFDASLPSGALVGAALGGSLFVAGLIALIAALVASSLKSSWMRYAAFLLGVMFLVGSDWGNGADFAKQFVAEAILLGAMVFGVRRVIRFNMLGCILVVALLALLGGAAQMLGQADGFYRTNGYALLAVMVLLLGWPFAVWRMRGSAES